MASAAEIEKAIHANSVTERDRLVRAFRISGIVAVIALVALVAWPWRGVAAFVAWGVSGVALTACLRLAWVLRDGERGRTVFDALWLRSTHSDGIAASTGGGDGADGGGGGD